MIIMSQAHITWSSQTWSTIYFQSPLHQIPGPIKDLSLSVWIKGVFEEVEGEAFMKPQERWWKEAGIDTPLIHWTGVFGQHFIMPLDADCVKQVLTSECHINPIYKKNYLVVKKCIGDGLITANGATWHRHRRIIQPAFENKLIENSLNAHVPGIVNRLITSWKTKGTDKDIDISSHFSAIALDILGQVAFSYDFQATNALERWASDMNFSAKPQHPLINALYKELMPNMVRVLLASFNLHHFDDTIIRSSRESRKILNEAVEAVVRKAQLDYSQSKESDNQNCLLNILFDAEDDGHIRHGKRTLSFKELQDETKTFLVAGHETTSTLCASAVHCLTKYPLIQKLVFEEIMNHASKEGTITLDMIGKMVYFDAFMHEVLRLCPPVGMIARVVTRRTNLLLGESLPAGTRIEIPIYLLHRHPKYWTDPEEFKPERWLRQHESREKKFHRFAFLPFSAGGRNCIGQRMGIYEAKLILAPIIREFEMMLSPSLENVDLKLVNFITLKPIPSVKVRVKRRL
jgi:cytochrome P450